MKRILFGLFVGLSLITSVYAEDKYEMSRVDLAETNYSAIVWEDMLYLIENNCNSKCPLYKINDKNEIEKTDKNTGIEQSVKKYYLTTNKNEDGSYDLQSCSNYKEICNTINDIDVSALYATTYQSYVWEESDAYIAESKYYIIKDKDSYVAIYNGKGDKLFDFGNYEILGEDEAVFDDDGISSGISKILLKDKDNGSYHFIGQDNKVVTLTKEMANKIGVTSDEIAKSLEYEIDKYYHFKKNYSTIFFTLTDGIVNSTTALDSSINQYNNKFVVEEQLIYAGAHSKMNLFTLEGNPIIEKEKYNQVYYFVSRPELVLAIDEYSQVAPLPNDEFIKSTIYIHDGKEIIYSTDLEEKDEIRQVMIDKNGIIWIDVRYDGEFSAIYVLRKADANSNKTPASEPKKDYSCKKIDGVYYNKNGQAVTKEQHEKECLYNTETGYIIPFIGGLIVLGGYVLIKKKPLKHI